MRTRLNILPQVSSKDDDFLSQRVSAQQRKMKTYTDLRRGAHTPTFKVGDSVHVRKPMHMPKAHQRFAEPVKKVGPATYLLQDGKKRHTSHLAWSNTPALSFQRIQQNLIT